jgi:hypothetical protein
MATQKKIEKARKEFKAERQREIKNTNKRIKFTEEYTEKVAADIRYYRAQGYCTSEIAYVLKIKDSTLRKWISRYPEFSEIIKDTEMLYKGYWDHRLHQEISNKDVNVSLLLAVARNRLRGYETPKYGCLPASVNYSGTVKDKAKALTDALNAGLITLDTYAVLVDTLSKEAQIEYGADKFDLISEELDKLRERIGGNVDKN